jgi:hypothetical protein
MKVMQYRQGRCRTAGVRGVVARKDNNHSRRFPPLRGMYGLPVPCSINSNHRIDSVHETVEQEARPLGDDAAFAGVPGSVAVANPFPTSTYPSPTSSPLGVAKLAAECPLL